MTRFRTSLIALTLCLLTTSLASAESDYDRWAYEYTRYGYLAIAEVWLDDDRVQDSDNANEAVVLSWYAWNEAWEARTTDNRNAWKNAWIYNAWAGYYCELAIHETGNAELWYAYQHMQDASNWCYYAYRYYR